MNIGFLDKNKRNETTFNWGPGMKIIFLGNTHRLNNSETTVVHMRRFLRSTLKGKDNLNNYLKVNLKNNKLLLSKSVSPLEFSGSFYQMQRAGQELGPCVLPVQGGGGEVYWIS